MLRSIALLFLLTALPAMAAPTAILIRNVRIFNGVDPTLTPGSVLVEDGRIRKVSSEAIDPPAGASVVDGGGRVLSPGFIDLHSHLMLQYPLSRGDYVPTVAGAYAASAASFYLDSGFTTVRDAGGTHPAFARAVDAGGIRGPRIYPAGAMISQTGGHGDDRLQNEPNPLLVGGSPYVHSGESVLADGVDRVLSAARENLKQGATQIKIMGSGGVLSDYDPIDSVQFSPEEIRAAVEAASDFGTYVMAHAYSSDSIRRLVENGVRSIEHGLLIDDATAQLVAKKGVVISTQIAVYRLIQDIPGVTPAQLEKLHRVLAGQDNLVKLIKKYHITTGFGTDLVFGAYVNLGKEFALRGEYWTAPEIMRQATSESAGVIRMAGVLNRYGNFGEVREGWLADLILIDGEPLQDISVLAQPDKAVVWVMKDGVIVKDSLLPGSM